MANTVIGEHSRVTLHFSLKLDDGSVVDSTFEGEPATFSVGDGNLLPGFEKALFGLKAGDEAQFEIPPEQGFGQRNPSNIQKVRRDSFSPDMELEPGLVVSFDNGGGELPGVIRSVGEDEVTVDFNHPLAGQTLNFHVKILQVDSIQ
ncbi:FKBP-type peptidyl-prolyl cis-trans isomerase [Microbulbifer thermotolerans]|uniref:Peptidyl-prolyl cis-trans isomerase n=1 Tax=Microbulbifer thermotolerans TaxID=252514 RepID=A0AB35I0S6_MICTH|nr:FKBP-type peptidyl-prolyl cis-trans isomerase [Microbulbifer thermotolerans]MCX2780245.1 FKBP-type peptidyl-prolyl cis-trans isomerase [Microbulbifer thermotolerans]MCX2783869.1 FKBP-type peptidyl-prolyl cis-trans isomerase [Microbulbifer thermotolerans]MCX2802611.1 FKBP-type peptidyl-prolyl cis-trans isomerase [Microbulbifer thermotolerans]MCX2805801.1 FKBP-type peptidyl-prolyl cis-trans isomerase [Microbulbifer thermotolerans]MCX2835619.1 FKBP-type peptidyl-prolyl cis-trans isomerase [Mic